MSFVSKLTLHSVFLAALLLLFGATSCFAEKLSLQLPWHHQFQFAGYYMAKELGYYRDAGLDVEINSVKQKHNVVETVLSGEADFGVASSGLLVERSLGKPIVAVATIFQDSATVFLSLKSSGIREPQDLIGKRVMLSPGYQSQALLALLHQEKVFDKIILQKTNYNLDSLLNGETDAFNAYSTNEPFLAKSKNQPVNIIDPRDYGIHFYGDTLFTTQSMIDKQPERVENFRRASLKGWKYALQNVEETIALIKKDYGVEKSLPALRFEANAIRGVIKPEKIPIGSMDLAQWAQITQYFIVNEQISPSFRLDSRFLYQPPKGIDWKQLTPILFGSVLVFTLLIALLLFIYYTGQQTNNALANLKVSEQRYRDLVESVPGLIYTFIPSQGGSCYSPRIKQILGHPVEHFIENPTLWHDSIHPDDVQMVDSILAEIKPDTVYELEYRIVDKAGDWHWFSDRFVKRTSPENGEQINGHATDITERKQAQQKQTEVDQRLRAALNAVSDGIWDWDVVTGETTVDWRTKEIFGLDGEKEYSAEELFQYVDPEDLPRIKQALEDHISGKIDQYDRTFRIHRPDGGMRWVRGRGKVIERNEAGNALRMIGTNTDITTPKLNEQRQQELEEQLRQHYKMEAIGTMAGGIAHDFNNSLAVIIGNIEMANLKLPKDSPVLRYIDQVKTAANRSKELVKQILLYSRQELQNQQPVRISLVIEETLGLLRPTIPSSVDIEYTADKASKNLTISADSTQLQQILINLSSNAIHAMEEKGLLKIELTSIQLAQAELPADKNLKAGNYIKLTVSDNGRGMSEEILKKAFDPFFTTKEVNQGTGMGLSVVHGIVERHAGFIEAQSVAGQGSQFTIYLPMIETSAEEIHQQEHPRPQGNERILVLDDVATLAELCGEMLAEHGYRVTTETSSHKVAKMFRENPLQFDLLITDQTMPGLSGTELAEQLLQLRPDLPIILCTGYSAKTSAPKAKDIGIREFCMKPLDLEKLLITVRQTLDSSQSP